jgi:hypothetical protein
MARKVLFSFHFDNDFWRTQQVRNMNALEGGQVCTPNAWEEVKRKGKTAIGEWIDENMWGKSCVVVLVGSQTASRPWERREIIKGWYGKKGVLGIWINKLLDTSGSASSGGDNPFDTVTRGPTGKKLSAFAPLKTPVGSDSKAVYASIRDNIGDWIEEAIRIRYAN